MSYPNRVRIAQREDEDEIFALCKDLYKENALFQMDDNLVLGMLRKAFNQEGGILGAIGDPGKIEGLIYMLISTFWYSKQHHLEELFLYVKPEFRHTRNAIDLMNFGKWCSDESGFPLVIGVISNSRTQGKVRLYRRQFASPVGNFFFYPPSKQIAAVKTKVVDGY